MDTSGELAAMIGRTPVGAQRGGGAHLGDVGAKGLESLAPLGPHGPVIMGCGCAGTAWLVASLGCLRGNAHEHRRAFAPCRPAKANNMGAMLLVVVVPTD